MPETYHVAMIYFCSYSIVTIFKKGTFMLFHILNVLYFYIRNFPKYVCSAKHGCFLQFLDFMLFRYVGRVFSERF